MDAQITLALASDITYVAGSINGTECVFEKAGEVWQATVSRNPKAYYDVSLTLVDAAGNQSQYAKRMYYGICLVTDRTQADVDFAKAQRKRILQYGWATLTQQEQAQWLAGLKGFYSVADLQRVDAAADTLAQKLRQAGYGVAVVRQDWALGDIPTPQELAVYLANVRQLREKFCVMPGREPLPETMESLDYAGANAIERTLLDIDYLIPKMQAAYRYAGEIYAGEV